MANMIPAMLAARSVVREKELGSIVNLYVTPVTRLEFLLGKQIPYVALGMLNFLLLAATAPGLVISTFMRSQTAALFGTALLTLLPAVQFSGMLDPVSSLEGAGDQHHLALRAMAKLAYCPHHGKALDCTA